MGENDLGMQYVHKNIVINLDNAVECFAKKKTHGNYVYFEFSFHGLIKHYE